MITALVVTAMGIEPGMAAICTAALECYATTSLVRRIVWRA